MTNDLILKPLRLPPDWLAAIESVQRNGENLTDFSRVSIVRELRRRGVDVSKLSEVRGRGKPAGKP